MADTAGFEPAICGLGGHRLIQLGHVSNPLGEEPFQQPIATKFLQKGHTIEHVALQYGWESIIEESDSR